MVATGVMLLPGNRAKGDNSTVTSDKTRGKNDFFRINVVCLHLFFVN